MAKTKRTIKARKTSRVQSKTAKRAPRRAASAKRVHLKPLYLQITRTIDQLSKLPPSDRVKFAIERLRMHQAEFESFCGPTMDIPAEPVPPVA